MQISTHPPSKSKITDFDLLGITPHLYFRGKEKQGSFFGFFLTLVLLVFTILCFFYFGQNLFYRTHSLVTSSDKFVTFPEKKIIDPETFPIALEINDPPGNKYFTENNMIKAKISQFTFQRINGTQELTIQNYPMEICTASHFSKLDNNIQSYFLTKNLTKYFCIPKNLKNLTMQGSFDQDLYQNIKLSFSICDNKTMENTCLSREEIAKQINIGYVGVYFVDSSFDSNDFERPFKETPKEFFTNFVLNSQKSINILFKNSYVETDEGIIFQNNRLEKTLTSDGFQEYNFMTPNDEFIMIYLRIRQEEIYYTRIYSKLQELLAQIGGFINIFWIFLSILNLFHARVIFIRDIILEVFAVKSILSNTTILEKKKEKEFIKQTTKKDFKFHLYQLNQDNILKDNPNELKIKNTTDCARKNGNYLSPKILDDDQNIEDVHHSLQFQNLAKPPSENLDQYEEISKLKLDIYDYIYYYTGYFKNPERERKKAILLKGTIVLQKNLDVKYIIQKFYEIEKLKFFLLSEEQLKSFNKIEKPELVFVKDSLSDSSSVETKLLRKRVSLMEFSKSVKKQKLQKSANFLDVSPKI